MTIVTTVATFKQLGFIAKLIADKDTSSVDSARLTNLHLLGKSGASKLIVDLIILPPKSAQAASAEVASGIYLTAGDRIYKVYKGQSGRMLAKLLELRDGDWEFTYAGMASRFVNADQKMNLEQAKSFGAIYGVCCNCGATLTNEISIAAGIGPICAGRF